VDHAATTRLIRPGADPITSPCFFTQLCKEASAHAAAQDGDRNLFGVEIRIDHAAARKADCDLFLLEFLVHVKGARRESERKLRGERFAARHGGHVFKLLLEEVGDAGRVDRTRNRDQHSRR